MQRVNDVSRCIHCGRPMELRVLRSGHAYWRCIELCTVREYGPDGGYYVGPETWRTGYFWPDAEINKALRQAPGNT